MIREIFMKIYERLLILPSYIGFEKFYPGRVIYL